MKRISVTIFSFLYFLLTAGFTINIHYCQDIIESVSINTLSAECCCNTAELPMECCGDEKIIFQYTPDNQLISSYSHDLKPDLLKIIHLPPVQLLDVKYRLKTIQGYNELPPPDDRPIWLLNSTFTFYG